MKHKHVDNSEAGEGHIVEVRVQGEVIAERLYAMRQPELCPWKKFAVCGHRVDWFEGSCLVRFLTTHLHKDGGLRSAREMRMTENFNSNHDTDVSCHFFFFYLGKGASR